MSDCNHCGAVGDQPHNCFGLKPMAIAPRKPILAFHFEKGPIEITPDHEANWWLAYAQPGVGHWYEIENEEGGLLDDGEFDGWIAECAA